ncbi:MAG: hypothetical protein NT121_25405, partial [Chloroflexi bacterium]|nr:hypothetical protein [Chloroflexota bacterium]
MNIKTILFPVLILALVSSACSAVITQADQPVVENLQAAATVVPTALPTATAEPAPIMQSVEQSQPAQLISA